MIFNPINEKTKFKKKSFFGMRTLFFSKKLNIRAAGGEPAMVLR
jgi:hypothetical protein